MVFHLSTWSQLKCIRRLFSEFPENRTIAVLPCDDTTSVFLEKLPSVPFWLPFHNFQINVEHCTHKVCIRCHVYNECVRNVDMYACVKHRTCSTRTLWCSIGMNDDHDSIFHELLQVGKRVLHEMFERVEVYHQIKLNRIRTSFFNECRRLCSSHTLNILRKYLRAKLFRIRLLRYKAYFGWLEHYYHPDVARGYCYKLKIKYLSC